jgi:hypothetical protein
MNTQKRRTGQHSDMFLHRHDRFSGTVQSSKMARPAASERDSLISRLRLLFCVFMSIPSSVVVVMFVPIDTGDA